MNEFHKAIEKNREKKYELTLKGEKGYSKNRRMIKRDGAWVEIEVKPEEFKPSEDALNALKEVLKNLQ